jgi:hypothetical protein
MFAVFKRAISARSSHQCQSRLPCGSLPHARLFHSTSPLAVAVGDSIPNVELMESSPGNKVNLAHLLQKGKGLVIGVPAAFSELSLARMTTME